MLGLVQRVSEASVKIEGEVVGSIAQGTLLLLGVEKRDTRADADKLLKKVLAYRIFEDGNGKMNLSLNDTGGGLLVISQFTLAADTNRGLRPSFSSAMPPGEAEPLVHYFIEQARVHHADVACGRFGADMKVSLVNDGPVTFMLGV